MRLVAHGNALAVQRTHVRPSGRRRNSPTLPPADPNLVAESRRICGAPTDRRGRASARSGLKQRDSCALQLPCTALVRSTGAEPASGCARGHLPAAVRHRLAKRRRWA